MSDYREALQKLVKDGQAQRSYDCEECNPLQMAGITRREQCAYHAAKELLARHEQQREEVEGIDFGESKEWMVDTAVSKKRHAERLIERFAVQCVALQGNGSLEALHAARDALLEAILAPVEPAAAEKAREREDKAVHLLAWMCSLHKGDYPFPPAECPDCEHAKDLLGDELCPYHEAEVFLSSMPSPPAATGEK